MTTIVHILEPSVTAELVAAWASEAGLTLGAALPVTYSRRVVTYRGADAIASWVARAGAALPLLVLEGPGAAALAGAAAARFAPVPCDELVGRVAAAADPVATLRALGDVAVLGELAAGPERERAIDCLGTVLLADEPVVRYAAAAILRVMVDRRAEAVLATAAARHPDLAPARDAVARSCAGAEDGTLDDGPTDSWYELERRARAGARAGQWRRVVKAAEELLRQDGDHVQGLYYRGLAHEADGEPLRALAYLGGARAAVALELSVYDEDRDPAAEDERADDRALAAELDERLARLREVARELAPAARAAAREPLVARLAAWWPDEATAAVGAARALAGLDPELEAGLAFLRGAYSTDRAELERALALAPDSLAVELRLARALGADDPARRLAIYERLLGQLRAGAAAPSSPAALLVERLAHEPATLADVLEALATAAYEQGDRPRAMELADELVTVNPDSIQGWQVRGHARLFEERYAEAAAAYADAIREITRIREAGREEGALFFGTDPRAMLHLNRACAFGRLGQQEETLECLREAVRADPEYATKAKTEDWIQCVWDRPEFAAIVARDPRALATRAELTVEHVAGLIDRCKGRFYRGDTKAALAAGERAVELASFRGDGAQEAAARGALAHALAFSGSSGRAVELVARAVALAAAGPAELRAETTATQAVVLHAHGDLDGAERAYLEGLELRRAVGGEDAPILAKSYGDLARLRADQGRPEAEVRATTQRGVDLLARFLEHHPEPDDDWIEAITDRGTLEANLARSHAREGSFGACLEALAAAAQTFTTAAPHCTLPPRVLQNAHELADAVAERAPDHAPRARALAATLDELRFPGAPAERRERAFFAGLRRVVARLRDTGVADGAIADAVRQAARGGASLPAELRDVPELRSLAAEFAARAARYPTFLVMGAMSLELLSSDLDGALTDLEELCVGYAGGAGE